MRNATLDRAIAAEEKAVQRLIANGGTVELSIRDYRRLISAQQPKPARGKWSFEIEYISAARNGKTGMAILRDERGGYAGKVYERSAAMIVAAINWYAEEAKHAGEPA